MADKVRDAMVASPPVLEGSATAQEAGEALSRDEVRAVFVCTGGKLAGVITRKTLVHEIVAAGRDPRTTRVADIAEPPNYTLDSEMPLEEGFRFMEERDLERVPVVDNGKLVGVLSRAVVQRRLAEDEQPADDDESVGVV